MALPEKDFLNLDEVAARWKHWGCDRATLESYARNDQLTFCIYLRDIGSHKSVRTQGDSVITHEVKSMRFVSPDAVVRRLFYLDGEDARRIFESQNDEQVAVNALYWTPQRIKKQAIFHTSPKYFTPKDLVITKDECVRFERRHNASGLPDLKKRIMFWLQEPSPSNTMTRIGSAVVVAVAALWALFKWYKSG